MNTHYLPRWLLKQFRGTTLYELDILTGTITSRSIPNAGSGEDLWPAEIEKDVLQRPDNQAAQLYRKKITHQRRINLAESERLEFAYWLSFFATRVPDALRRITHRIASEKSDTELAELTELAVNGIQDRRETLLAKIRAQNPSLYQEAIDEFGKEQIEAFLISACQQKIRDGIGTISPDPKKAHHYLLRNASNSKMATVFSQNQWSWIQAPMSQAFVIGDNPLVRLHKPSGRWNYGIALRDVQISMPLSSTLCLVLDGPSTGYTGYISPCTKELAMQYNLRQRITATHFVYAGDQASLEPLR